MSSGTPRRARALGDDDDERPTLLRTPRAAEYTTDAAGAQPEPARYPALAEMAGVAALVDRFKLVFAEQAGALFPTDVNKFRHETVRTGLKEHTRLAGLLQESDYVGGTLAPIIIQRPAFSDTVFLGQTPAPDAEAGASEWPVKLFSVPNMALAGVMVRKGYKIVHVTHLPGDETRLPPALEEVTRDTAPDVELHPAPSMLKLPDKVMPIEQGGSAPTAAAQIVEQFEIKVLWRQPNGSVVVYSPMRLWTKQARKANNFLSTQRQPFGVRCMIYYYIRTVLREQPALVTLSFDKLRDACKELKSRKRSRAAADAEGGCHRPSPII